MVVTSRCFAFALLPRKHEFEKRFEFKNSTSLRYLPISSSVKTWKIFRHMLCQFFFFAWADILNKKNPYFGNHLFCKTKTSSAYKTSRLVRISLFQCSKQASFAFFSGKLFYKSSSLDSYANPRLCLGSAWLSRILLTPLAFILGYANTENVFYCLNVSLRCRHLS